MRRNQTDSPLLNLPPELRNMIYSYTLSIGTWTIAPRAYAWINDDDLDTEAIKTLSLLSACRQIYHDTFLLPFILNAFFFRFANIPQFLAKLTARQRCAITHFTLEMALDFSTVNPSLYFMWDEDSIKYQHLEVLTQLPGLRRLELIDMCECGTESKEECVEEVGELIDIERVVVTWKILHDVNE